MLLKFAIKEFLDEKKFKNVTQKTLSNYKHTLEQFHFYAIQHEIVDLADITQNTIKGYLHWCKNDRNNRPVSVNSKLLSLKIFFNYIQNADISKTNPTKKVEYLKTDVNIRVPTDKQIGEILSYFRRLKGRDKTLYSMRDSMMVIILISSGLRLSEMLSLKWTTMDFQNGYMIIFGKARTVQGVPMSGRLKQEILEYRIFCEKHFGKLPEYVFTNRKSKQMTPDSVKNVFKRLNKALNYEHNSISCHKFRHYYASVLVKNGVDGFSLMGLLRHKNISTSQRYVNLFSCDLSEKNERYNPLNNLDM